MEEARASGRDGVRGVAHSPSADRPHGRHATLRTEAKAHRRRTRLGAPVSRRAQWPYALLAYACATLAVVGIVVPGLPTTPFALVAAWAARRGSPALDRWLRTHRQIGPLLHHWETERAVPLRAKLATLALLALSWTVLAAHSDGALAPTVVGALFVAVALFVTSRPRPSARPLPAEPPGPAP